MTKGDLAGAVAITLGLDALANKNCRDALAKAKGLASPARWRPGTAAARDFTERLGLPPEFAGERRRIAEDAFYEIEAIPAISPLRDFQLDTVSKCHQVLTSERHERALLCMPTGSGKTRVSLEAIKQYIAGALVPGEPLLIVWMAQKEELLEQAAESLRAVWSSSSGLPSVAVIKNFSSYRPAVEARWREIVDALVSGPAILFTTPQSFNNLIRENLSYV